MPKTLPASVSASAGMPSAFALATASSRRTMPSVTEYSLCILRWTKRGASMEVVKSLPSEDAEFAIDCAVRGRNVHRALADLGADRGRRPYRKRILARFPRSSPALDIVFLIASKREKSRSPAMEKHARRGRCVRGRSRLLALVDTVHLGRQFDAAGQSGLDLRHAGGVGPLEGAPEGNVRGGPCGGAGRRRPAGPREPGILADRAAGRRPGRGDRDVLCVVPAFGEGPARPWRRHAATDGGDDHAYRSDPAPGRARLGRGAAARDRDRLAQASRPGVDLARRGPGPYRLRARAPGGGVFLGGAAVPAGHGR